MRPPSIAWTGTKVCYGSCAGCQCSRTFPCSTWESCCHDVGHQRYVSLSVGVGWCWNRPCTSCTNLQFSSGYEMLNAPISLMIIGIYTTPHTHKQICTYCICMYVYVYTQTHRHIYLFTCYSFGITITGWAPLPFLGLRTANQQRQWWLLHDAHGLWRFWWGRWKLRSKGLYVVRTIRLVRGRRLIVILINRVVYRCSMILLTICLYYSLLIMRIGVQP